MEINVSRLKCLAQTTESVRSGLRTNFLQTVHFCSNRLVSPSWRTVHFDLVGSSHFKIAGLDQDYNFKNSNLGQGRKIGNFVHESISCLSLIGKKYQKSLHWKKV